MDEPMADSSALPTYLVSYLAREHVTVALSGDGGDELLGGYRRYFLERRDRLSLRMPAAIRSGMQWVGACLPVGTPGSNYLQYIGMDALARYVSRFGIAKAWTVLQLLTPDVLHAAGEHDPLDHLRAIDPFPPDEESVNRFSYLDCHSYLPDDILVKVDRMSMASSLEVRSPFLDHRLFELVATMPEPFRATATQSKRILRAVVAPLLPAATLQKPKQGFAVPIETWFRGRALPYLEATLFDSRTRSRGLWRESAVRKLLRIHQSGRTDHSLLLWALLCLELWQRQLLDDSSTA
jgi:asparagine synthase (glutamine-hydrolysing)